MIPIQFSHANGFPAKSYQFFFDQLQPHPVSYVNVFGEGKPHISTWEPYLEELISDIESKHDRPVIGLGHSFGGALTLKAAMLRPDLFEKVIMLDPPIFGRFKRNMIRAVNLLGITEKTVPIVKKAANRRDHFANKKEAFDYWQPKGFFRKFHPTCFQAYVEEGLKPASEGGVELIISKQQEVNVFKLPPRLSRTSIKVPAYFIYATQNGVLTPGEVKEHRRNFPGVEFIPWEGQHMFPMEEPVETAAMVKTLIQGQGYNK
ncbi:MAG: alpha/beta hydrolase [Bacteroidia bacterium]